jgi:tetratricopeptide (TPR) repeat protein
MRSSIAVVALVVSIAWQPPASGEPRGAVRQARELVERGVAAYDRGRFEEALRLFERAERLAPSTRLLFNIAQAHAMLGECEDALVYFRRFRDQMEAAGQPAPRTLAAHIDRMKTCVERRAERAAAAPAERQPERSQPLDASLEARRHATVDRGRSRRTAGWVVAGVGGAATATAAITGVLAYQRQADLDEVCNDLGMCPEELDDDVASYQRLRVTAFVSGAVGVSAIAVGVWLIVTAPSAESRQDRSETASRVRPWIGPRVLGIAGEF